MGYTAENLVYCCYTQAPEVWSVCFHLSQDFTPQSGSDKMLCNKIDKPTSGLQI